MLGLEQESPPETTRTNSHLEWKYSECGTSFTRVAAYGRPATLSHELSNLHGSSCTYRHNAPSRSFEQLEYSFQPRKDVLCQLGNGRISLCCRSLYRIDGGNCRRPVIALPRNSVARNHDASEQVTSEGTVRQLGQCYYPDSATKVSDPNEPLTVGSPHNPAWCRPKCLRQLLEVSRPSLLHARELR